MSRVERRSSKTRTPPTAWPGPAGSSQISAVGTATHRPGRPGQSPSATGCNTFTPSSTVGNVEMCACGRLAKGGRDNGKPGLRKDYGPHYYAAYVFDPEGYRLEAYYGGK